MNIKAFLINSKLNTFRKKADISGEIIIFAKEQQIKLIDYILTGMCIEELTHQGRVTLLKVKKGLISDITALKNYKHELE